MSVGFTLNVLEKKQKFCCNKCKCENKDEIEKLTSEVADLEERMEKYKTITEGSTDQVTRLKNEMKVMRRGTAKLKEEKEDKEKENHQLQEEIKQKNRGLELTTIQYNKIEKEMRTVKENAETNENFCETIRNLQQANQGLKKENETRLGFMQEAIQPTQHDNKEKQKVQEINELKHELKR